MRIEIVPRTATDRTTCRGRAMFRPVAQQAEPVVARDRQRIPGGVGRYAGNIVEYSSQRINCRALHRVRAEEGARLIFDDVATARTSVRRLRARTRPVCRIVSIGAQSSASADRQLGLKRRGGQCLALGAGGIEYRVDDGQIGGGGHGEVPLIASSNQPETVRASRSNARLEVPDHAWSRGARSTRRLNAWARSSPEASPSIFRQHVEPDDIHSAGPGEPGDLTNHRRVEIRSSIGAVRDWIAARIRTESDQIAVFNSPPPRRRF